MRRFLQKSNIILRLHYLSSYLIYSNVRTDEDVFLAFNSDNYSPSRDWKTSSIFPSLFPPAALLSLLVSVAGGEEKPPESGECSGGGGAAAAPGFSLSGNSANNCDFAQNKKYL